ncbi:MAG: hypothetical protein K6G88_07225 [Lachnospiraceae bacterium]|nr:hypothetical protein [Lachnospiraceae bacterium]
MTEQEFMEIDFWANMVDVRGTSDEKLREKFEGFTLSQNKMLLKMFSEAKDDRMKEVVEILRQVISKKDK